MNSKVKKIELQILNHERELNSILRYEGESYSSKLKLNIIRELKCSLLKLTQHGNLQERE